MGNCVATLTPVPEQDEEKQKEKECHLFISSDLRLNSQQLKRNFVVVSSTRLWFYPLVFTYDNM